MPSTFDFEKIQCHKLYINGQFVDAIKGGTFFTINPATGAASSANSQQSNVKLADYPAGWLMLSFLLTSRGCDF